MSAKINMQFQNLCFKFQNLCFYISGSGSLFLGSKFSVMFQSLCFQVLKPVFLPEYFTESLFWMREEKFEVYNIEKCSASNQTDNFKLIKKKLLIFTTQAT